MVNFAYVKREKFYLQSSGWMVVQIAESLPGNVNS